MRLPIKTSSRWLQAAALAALLLSSIPALADETSAESMFREGRALMLGGRFDEACPLLEESERLEPHVGTLLNVAACHERQGKVGSAWVEYQKALTAARAEGQTDRAQLAGDRIKVLEPRVPWLRVSSTTDDVTITLDGGRLEHVAWGQEMPVDPGPHAVVAQRSGAQVFEERLDLHEGDHRAVRIDVAAPATTSAGAPPPQDRIVVEPKPTPSPVTPSSTNRWILEPGLFLGVVGGTAKASVSCPGTCGDVREGGIGAGLSLFGGRSFGDVSLGGRFSVASTIDPNGPTVFGVGPEVTLKMSDAFTVGAWALMGSGWVKGNAEVKSGNGAMVTSDRHAEGDLPVGFGFGIELSLRLLQLPRGELLASSTPFFLIGHAGSIVSVPLGLAYRFQ